MDCFFAFLVCLGCALFFLLALIFCLIGVRRKLRKIHNQLIESEQMAFGGRMISGISHDISSKMGVCVSAVSFLRDTGNQTRKRYKSGNMKKSDLMKHMDIEKEFLERTMFNLEDAVNLIGNLKKISINQFRRNGFHFYLKDYLEKILFWMNPRLRKTKHQVELICDSFFQIKMNLVIFSQVLSNFVDNSLIYGFDNIDSGIIIIQANIENNDLILLYSDNGKGISSHRRSQIFKPYYTTRKKSGGTGLGLSIIYDLLVRSINGSIECKSFPGERLSFII